MFITSMTHNADLGGTANRTETPFAKNTDGTAIIWLDKDSNHSVKEEISHWLLSKDGVTDVRFSPISSKLLNIGIKFRSEQFPALAANLETDFPDAQIIGF